MSFAYCDCGQQMNPANACKFNIVIIGSKEYSRTPYNEGDICHDCNVAVGQYHHNGCDMERCPKCSGQLISCFCKVINVATAESTSVFESVEVRRVPEELREALRIVNNT